MRHLRFTAAVIASIALLSCGGTPSSPSAPAGTVPLSNAVVTAAGAVRVSVVGTPPTIGMSSQFAAMAVQADGSTQTVTSQAVWGSSDPAVATVTAGGMVTARAAGAVAIAATYAGSQGSLSFTVTSAATFTLRGTVKDASSGSGIAAAITAKDAAGRLKSAATDGSGSYSIAGVPAGTVDVTVEAANYATQTRSITVYGDTVYSFLLSRLTSCPQIGFDNVGAQGGPFTSYTACGFTVTATTTNWTVSTGYGHPAPFIQFTTAANTVGTGEIVVTAGGNTFTFQSVDVYSSTTPIPYVMTGIANSVTVFTAQNMIGNTYGNFATVPNPSSGVPIDTLVIRLTNPSVLISNPMGLDNIVVR